MLLITKGHVYCVSAAIVPPQKGMCQCHHKGMCAVPVPPLQWISGKWFEGVVRVSV